MTAYKAHPPAARIAARRAVSPAALRQTARKVRRRLAASESTNIRGRCEANRAARVSKPSVTTTKTVDDNAPLHFCRRARQYQ